MKLERTFDAARFNAVLNHPAVFPWVSAPGIERLDSAATLADDKNVLLMNEHGGFLFVPTKEGQYEVHTQFTPEGRGNAYAAACQAAAYMFGKTDCTSIITYVPEGNTAAKRLTEAMGFSYTGREGHWTYPDGNTVPLDWYILTKETWQCRQQL